MDDFNTCTHYYNTYSFRSLKSKIPTLQVRQGRNIYIAEKNEIEVRALAQSVVYVGPSLRSAHNIIMCFL